MDLSGFQPINYQVLEIDDFSGGITDNYIGGPINKYHEADNLMLEKYGTKAKLRLRSGSEIFDSANPVLNNTASRGQTLKYFSGAILGWSTNKVYYQASSGAWTNLVGPNGGNSVFTTASDGSNIVSVSEWQNHLLVANDNYEYISKIYKNSASAYQIRTAGLPELTATPVLTTSSAGANSYLYRFCYKYSYLVGTVQYVDRGALTEASVSSAATINTAQPMAISGIPSLSNTANTTLWDTTNIDVEIYRTTNGGTNFYLAKTIDNGTLSTSDTMTDATLILQEALYTEGDIVENEPVPKAGLVHVVEDTSTAYYARIKEGTETRNNVLRQSVPGDIDSCPTDFELEVGDDIVGLSSHLGRPIICGTNNVYRVDGAFDRLGRGAMVAQKISDRADCVSSQSVVQTLYGTFWCGKEYFYYTDGYKVLRLNSEFTATHQLFTDTSTQRKKIQGKYDRKNNRIWWTVQEDASSSDNDKCYILHLNFWDFQTEDAPFTTATGGDEFRPTSIEFVDDTMYRGDAKSYILIHREDGTKTDPKIDSTLGVGSWGENTILYTYESVSFNMGNSSIRKASPRICIKALNESPLSLDIISINDGRRLTETLRPIRSRSSLLWGDSEVEWGDPDLVWNYESIIDEQRRFPRASYRYSEKQIKLTNAYVVVTNSSTVESEATTNTTTKTVALSGATFPSNSIGYGIAFETDGYVREFTVTAINSSNDTVTVSDVSNLLPSSAATTLQWVLRGYPKGEDLGLLSYSIDYVFLGKTQNYYRKGSTGELT